MNDARERMEQLLAGLNPEERRELSSLLGVFDAGELSEPKLKLMALLNGLDSLSRTRASEFLVALYDAYVHVIPFMPDQWGKAKLRPTAVDSAERFVNDWCSWEK